jgi:hypothetical protein
MYSLNRPSALPSHLGHVQRRPAHANSKSRSNILSTELDMRMDRGHLDMNAKTSSKDLPFVVLTKSHIDSVDDATSLVTPVDPKLERLSSSREDREELLSLRGTDAAACLLNTIQLVSAFSFWLSHIC